jgi:hypothetical protein
MRAFAIKRLVPLTSCIDKIVLAREYDVDEWLKGVNVKACKMDKLPSDKDCDRLGFDLFKKIARAWESLRVSRPTKNSAIEGVIEDVFGLLPSPSPECVASLSPDPSRPPSPPACFEVREKSVEPRVREPVNAPSPAPSDDWHPGWHTGVRRVLRPT